MTEREALAMRIVSITHYFACRRGGIEAVALELNDRLAAIGCEVDWFASAEDELPESRARLRCRPMRAVHVVERVTGLPLPFWVFPDLRHLWSAIRQCDIVHVHDFIYPGSILGLVAARFHGKPVVLTQHIGLVPYRRKMLTSLLDVVNRTIGRFVLDRVEQAVFVSDAVKTYFVSFCRFSGAPEYIPNGVDTGMFAPSMTPRKETCQALGLDFHRPVCLFVGRFVEKKGLHLLREIVGLTPEVQWLFAGSGPLDPRQWNYANVRVFSGLSRETLVPLYQSAHLLVLPSRGEGFPLVVQEAFACGTPALVSDDTAAGCLDASWRLLTCPVTGPDVARLWRDAIVDALSDTEELARRSSAVRVLSRELWAWENSVRRYLEIYGRLAPTDGNKASRELT